MSGYVVRWTDRRGHVWWYRYGSIGHQSFDSFLSLWTDRHAAKPLPLLIARAIAGQMRSASVEPASICSQIRSANRSAKEEV